MHANSKGQLHPIELERIYSRSLSLYEEPMKKYKNAEEAQKKRLRADKLAQTETPSPTKGEKRNKRKDP